MPQAGIAVTESDAQGIGKRTNYALGRLMPITKTFYEWADNVIGPDGKPVRGPDGKPQKVPNTGGERTYEEYLKLPDNKKGQKWRFEVDPRVLKPDLEFSTSRGIMVGFDEWGQVVLPSILDVVGQGDESLKVFIQRAGTGDWFIEAEMKYIGMYQDKPQTTFKFTRMTQNLDELKAWNLERYPKHENAPSPEVVEKAKLVYTRIAKKDRDRFLTLANGDAELAPFADKFAANDFALLN